MNAALLEQKIFQRFDELISEGKSILSSPTQVPAKWVENWVTQQMRQAQPAHEKYDYARFVVWKTNAISLLALVILPGSVHIGSSQKFSLLRVGEEEIQWGVSFLQAIKSDIELGFLDALYTKVEKEVAADYMGQAERLLGEGTSGKYDHVPAAVLAGAVLESELRRLCTQQVPPLSTVKPNGAPKLLNLLIDDLTKAGAFNETAAKKLRFWTDIRNNAAHGKPEEFTRQDVDSMIKGIQALLNPAG